MVPKENPGEMFEGLDMLTSLLTPKSQKLKKPVIEVIKKGISYKLVRLLLNAITATMIIQNSSFSCSKMEYFVFFIIINSYIQKV